MNKFNELLKKVNPIYYIITIILLSLILIGLVYLKIEQKEKIVEVPVMSECEEKENKNIKVDIKGNVLNPGVYELSENSRVNDAILVAGGLLEDSDTSSINLSKKLKDEMTIIIYSKKQIEEYKESNKKIEYVYVEIEKCPDSVNDACINKEEDKPKTEEKIDDSLISINTADIEKLKSLPGIGESKANDIINYRNNNGPFKSIEDIKKVSGIGDSLFEKINSYITV